MTLPLEGIKVLDLSRLLPGPFATMMLGDMGAEIVRVEEPRAQAGRRAELARGTVGRPERAGEELERARAFDCVGRNKKSIILNLKDPRAQAVAHRLAGWADVLVEEFRPGVPQRLGVDYETLRGINPRLVYCSVTLYGQAGPYKDLPGHDPCALALAGVIGLGAVDEEEPRIFSVPADDIATALHATIGILLALRARDLTGKGQHVDISMTDAALDFLPMVSSAYFRGSSIPRINRLNPSSGVWKTSDGKYICTTNLEAHHWANFCRVIGREDLIPYQYDRGRRRELYELVRDIFLTRTRDEWLEVLQGDVETQAAPVYELPEVFSDPQVLHRRMVEEIDHPEFGNIRHLGISIKLSETPGQIRSLASLPGQHTDQVLSSLGYSPAEIADLRSGGAVG